MKVYLDLILILNFILDFFLLLGVGLILKRKIDLKRITISSLIGSLSILILFYPITSLCLFIIKICLSILMIIVAYPKRDGKYFFTNLLLFYIVSIFLGGFLYLINIQLSYQHYGLIFMNNGFSLNFIITIIISPFIIYFYIKEQRLVKNKYNNYYNLQIKINNHIVNSTGYLDSGNNLTYKGYPVILIDKRQVIFLNKGYRIIPYKSVNGIHFIKIYKCDDVVIQDKHFKNIYLGCSEELFNLDGVDVLLNNKLMEDL